MYSVCERMKKRNRLFTASRFSFFYNKSFFYRISVTAPLISFTEPSVYSTVAK